MPSYINTLLDKYPVLDYSQTLISIVLMVFIIVRHKFKFTVPLFWLILQYSILSISTKINNGEFNTVLKNSVLLILLCLTLDAIIRDKDQLYALLTVVRNLMLLFLIIDIIYTLIMPEGIPDITFGVTPYFLYGNMNTTVKFIFPGLCCSFILDHLKNKRISFSTLAFLIGFLFLCFHIHFMATGVIGIFFVFLWMLFQKKINRHPKIALFIVILMVLLVETQVVFKAGEGSFSNFISSALGKDLSFSGRAPLWMRTITAIENKPMLGYGLRQSDYIQSVVGLKAGSHNYYLDIMFQAGVAGLLVFLSIIVYIFSKLKNNLNIYEYILLGFLCAYLIMFLSEPFYSTEKFHIPIIYLLATMLGKRGRSIPDQEILATNLS